MEGLLEYLRAKLLHENSDCYSTQNQMLYQKAPLD